MNPQGGAAYSKMLVVFSVLTFGAVWEYFLQGAESTCVILFSITLGLFASEIILHLIYQLTITEI